jgi:hypothetical protein
MHLEPQPHELRDDRARPRHRLDGRWPLAWVGRFRDWESMGRPGSALRYSHSGMLVCGKQFIPKEEHVGRVLGGAGSWKQQDGGGRGRMAYCTMNGPTNRAVVSIDLIAEDEGIQIYLSRLTGRKACVWATW